MREYAVEVRDVTMRFNLSRERTDTLKEYALKLLRNKGKRQIDEFFALRNISIQVEKGDSYAILGSNGSGKSTLLKIVSGIYRPTSGSVCVRGSIAPMIELGAGFDNELTGRENIFLNGAVLGYPRSFMQDHFDEIVRFAELLEFIDVPIKNYSSGMKARLGFAVATVVDPDILIVDEILSVGDARFRKKCKEKINVMKKKGITLFLVSHSIDQVKALCSHAAWIEKGALVMNGDAKKVCDAYMKSMDL